MESLFSLTLNQFIIGCEPVHLEVAKHEQEIATRLASNPINRSNTMQVFLKDANGNLSPIERGTDEAAWLVEGIDNIDAVESRSPHWNPTFYYGLVLIDGKPTPLPLAMGVHDQIKAYYTS